MTNRKKTRKYFQYFTNSMILFRMTTATFSGRQHSAALCTIYTHTLICTPSYKNRPMYVQLVYRQTSHNVRALSLAPRTYKETRCTSRTYTTITGRSRRARINSNESKQNRTETTNIQPKKNTSEWHKTEKLQYHQWLLDVADRERAAVPDALASRENDRVDL